MIELVLKIASVVLGFAAIYFVVTDAGSDYAFAAVVLTISAAFLSYRFHIKERLNRREIDGDSRRP